MFHLGCWIFWILYNNLSNFMYHFIDVPSWMLEILVLFYNNYDYDNHKHQTNSQCQPIISRAWPCVSLAVCLAILMLSKLQCSPETARLSAYGHHFPIFGQTC